MNSEIFVKKTSFRDEAESFFKHLQEKICQQFETITSGEKFKAHTWKHPEGGGGTTCLAEHGKMFERACVNFSSVETILPKKLADQLSVEPQKIIATGISLVLHPLSPMIPTVHMNLRYLELASGDAWFGGGVDLTPYYLFEDDVKHFHRTLQSTCNKHDPSYYPRFKQWCDEYFLLKHRSETRGIGGIFFDYLREDQGKTFSFVQNIGDAFLAGYIPIVERRRNEPWGEQEREWQAIRHGRYVEFNLLYDRGTLFGLETQGRTESILMSLPRDARWVHDFTPEPGSREAELLKVLKEPREWV